MKYFFSLLLFTQLCFANDPCSLKNLVNDYIYDLSVEWDQNNVDYELRRTEEFKQDIATLIRLGLTREEIYEFFSGLDLKSIESELTLMDSLDPHAMARFVARKKIESIKRAVDWRGLNPLLTTSFIGAGIWTVILLSNALDTQAEVL
jgi:hypothetical protein